MPSPDLLIEREPKSVSPTERHSAASSVFYAPELDALRFFAFVGVFFFHALPDPQSVVERHLPLFLSDLFGIGAFGVDLFFLLSAYLITELLLREKEKTGNVNLKAFYIRRIARIWPLYFFFLAIALALQYVVQGQHLSAVFVLGYVLLIGNWVVSILGMPSSVAVPLWTVSIEEQFYLLWPLVVRRVRRNHLVAAAIFILALCNFSRLVMFAMHAGDNLFSYSTFSRIDAIAVGVLFAAVLNHQPPNLRGNRRFLLALLGVGIWVATSRLCRMNNLHPVPSLKVFAYPLIAIGSAAIFAACLGNVCLASKSLSYLGKISYGLYIYHYMVIRLLHQTLFPHSAGMIHFSLFLCLSACITLLLAAASYQWIERPFLKLKERYTVVQSRPV